MTQPVAQPRFLDVDGTEFLLEPRQAAMIRIIIALAPRMRRMPVGELMLRFNGESIEAMVGEWLSARSFTSGNVA